MKRHRALVALSHDHHHALVAARRLARAAGGEGDPDAAAEFGRFFAATAVPHFREEEEWLFPLVVDDAEAQPLVVEALLQHQRLHALAARLAAGEDLPGTMADLAQLLEAHVRLEERRLFPLIERAAAEALDASGADRGRDRVRSRGPVWSAASEDLNATVLAWDAGDGPHEHVNDERDVLVAVLEGSAAVRVEGSVQELAAGDVLIVEKGRRRAITAGSGGVRYVAVHLRRPPLQIRRAAG